MQSKYSDSDVDSICVIMMILYYYEKYEKITHSNYGINNDCPTALKMGSKFSSLPPHMTLPHAIYFVLADMYLSLRSFYLVKKKNRNLA